jgi:hypothetical protein
MARQRFSVGGAKGGGRIPAVVFDRRPTKPATEKAAARRVVLKPPSTCVTPQSQVAWDMLLRRALVKDLLGTTPRTAIYDVVYHFTIRSGAIRIINAGYWRKGKREYEKNQLHR